MNTPDRRNQDPETLESVAFQRSGEDLQRNEADNGAILRAFPDLLFVNTLEGVFLDCRTQHEGQLMIGVELLLGKNIRDFYPSELADRIIHEFHAALATRKTQVVEHSSTILTGPGHFEARITPMDNGRLLTTIRDVTSRKMVEQAMLRDKETAEAASLAKTEFLDNMSHEIRTPLNGIMGMMQILLKAKLEREQKEYVKMAVNAADRLGRLLSDILDLSRAEAGKLTLHEETFDIRKTWTLVKELLSINARFKKVALECSIDPAMPEKIIGDETRVRQILFILLGNALKFTDRGRIGLEVTPVSPENEGVRRILFIVSDTGIGIPENRLHTLFRPFSQVDGSYTRKYQGAGLGLAIIRRLVAFMGGNIAIESELGLGTTIHVVLPFRVPVSASREDRDLVETSPAPQRLRILLVEDDPTNQLAMRTLLEKMGHETTLANNGRHALKLFVAHHFDCILMDVQMPVMNGLDTTRVIRRLEAAKVMRQRQVSGDGKAVAGQTGKAARISRASQAMPGDRIPIIAVTAHALPDDRSRILAAGMDDYLAKPVLAEDLQRLLSLVPARTSS